MRGDALSGHQNILVHAQQHHEKGAQDGRRVGRVTIRNPFR